ncbi:MAG TPA: DUF4249 domain-containing protein [Chitinophagaceae bacterium]|nr:DUF4249 domain-containing protein [Chitinophagaceae bacterium]
MKDFLCLVGLFVVANGCKKLYNPHVDSPATGYLVVEGFINTGGGVSTITLNRTTKLRDTVKILYEHNADVSIESDNNESFPLPEVVNGAYTSGPLHLNAGARYRLRITTESGKQYLSDFSAVQHTPSIDSLDWEVEHAGVRVYVNTHDDQSSTRYYRWTYSETWEFHSRFLKTLSYIIDSVTNLGVGVTRLPNADTTIYKCWRTQASTDIILGSSEKLATDRIHLPVRYIEPQSDELTVLYYIHVKQIALSHEAYLFYQNLKKNTEQLGTIFDPMPSEVPGNIHCTNDPDEVVIGYVESSEEQDRDIFIRNKDLPMTWISQMGCGETEVQNQPPLDVFLIPTRVGKTGPGGSIASFYVSDPICVDCTMRGTNVKPAFWP